MDEEKAMKPDVGKTTRTFMLLAIVTGLIAMLLGWTIISRAEKKYGPKRTYMAAAVKMPAGSQLAEQMIIPKTIPQKLASPNAIQYSERGLYINATLNFPVEEGEIILKTMVTQPERYRQLSATMDSTRGKRAVTIAVDEISGVGGFLKEGDRVDIVATFSEAGQTKDRYGRETAGKKMTKVILHNIPILALGFHTGKSEQTYSSITLSMSIEEAQMLILSMKEGDLTLLLRPKSDNYIFTDLPIVRMATVLEARKISSKSATFIQ